MSDTREHIGSSATIPVTSPNTGSLLDVSAASVNNLLCSFYYSIRYRIFTFYYPGDPRFLVVRAPMVWPLVMDYGFGLCVLDGCRYCRTQFRNRDTVVHAVITDRYFYFTLL